MATLEIDNKLIVGFGGHVSNALPFDELLADTPLSARKEIAQIETATIDHRPGHQSRSSHRHGVATYR